MSLPPGCSGPIWLCCGRCKRGPALTGDQGLVGGAGFGRYRLQHLLVRGLVLTQQPHRGHRLGAAKPVAGVLHQKQLGRQGKGPGLGRAALLVFDGAADALGVNGQRLALGKDVDTLPAALPAEVIN